MLKSSLLFRIARQLSGRAAEQLRCYDAVKPAIGNAQSCWFVPNRSAQVFGIDNHPYRDLVAARTDKERKELAEKKLAELTEEDKKRLEAIILEYQVALARGDDVPESLSSYDKLMLLTLGPTRRVRFLKYLRGVEWKRMQDKTKQKKRMESALPQNPPTHESLTDDDSAVAQPKLESESVIDSSVPEPRKASEMVNKIYMRIYESKRHASQQNKQLNAMRFGLPLVFDCSYGAYMRPQDAVSMVEQMQHSYAANRSARSPFNLILCNLERNGAQQKLIERMFMRGIEYVPFESHEQSYLDVLCNPKSEYLDCFSGETSQHVSSGWLNQPRQFKKEQIVYLSPHSRTDMSSFDPNCVYVIGAFVNKITDEPISLAKARRDGVRCERLPLDRYVSWSVGKKALTLDCVVRILLHLAESPENNSAFRKAFIENLPSRVIKSDTPASDDVFNEESNHAERAPINTASQRNLSRRTDDNTTSRYQSSQGDRYAQNLNAAYTTKHFDYRIEGGASRYSKPDRRSFDRLPTRPPRSTNYSHSNSQSHFSEITRGTRLGAKPAAGRSNRRLTDADDRF